MEDRKINIEKDESVISDGLHLLSGVDEFRIEQDWGDDIDGWAIELDGDVYIAYYDPDDGYRSYAGIRLASDAEKKSIRIINRFPPQEVTAASYKETIEEDGWTMRDASVFKLMNYRGDTVLEVSTDYSEDYYPCGHVEWNPENLPVNLRTSEENQERTDETDS